MKVNFQFNDVNRVVLTPETPREHQLIQLAFLSDKERPLIEFTIGEKHEITLTLIQANANPKSS